MRQLSADEIERYARQLVVKEIGGAGQQKLATASVSVVGAGALGGPCALYLAAAGMGKIEIIDDDTVDRSNLARQIQFQDADVSRSKTEALRTRLNALNPKVQVSAIQRRFLSGMELSGDVLIDASDNFETRFELNELAHRSGRKLISGAAGIWTGQVAVFESGTRPEAPCYRCFVPQTPPNAGDCNEIGVIGPVTGMIGSRMALETIKLAVGASVTLGSQLWIFDGLSGHSRSVKLQKDPNCPVCSQP